MNTNTPVKNRYLFLNAILRCPLLFTLVLMLVGVSISAAACSSNGTQQQLQNPPATTQENSSGLYTYNPDKSTSAPIDKPTAKPTNKPTDQPSDKPTGNPTVTPNYKPTETDKLTSPGGYQDIFTMVQLYSDDSNAKFTHLPMDLEQISSIVPLGEADSVAGESSAAKAAGAGAHVLPTDHITVFSGQKGDSHTYKVYAVADSYLVQVDYETGRWASPDGTPNKIDDYALTFEVSKSLFIIETHLTGIAPELKTQLGVLKTGDQNFVKIQVNAGELLGQGGGTPYLNSNDLWTIDKSKPAAFIHPDWWGYKSGYAQNALDYFIGDLRNKLINFLPQRPEPRGGQFAFDIDGKLIGSWFPLMNGQDLSKPPQQRANLSFFYFADNPAIIKIGYDPTGTVYIIKGNGPDPATISVQSGLVKYELMNSRSQDPKNPTYFKTETTMLVQMLDNRTIKMELFDGKTADQVGGFDSNAIEFYR